LYARDDLIQSRRCNVAEQSSPFGSADESRGAFFAVACRRSYLLYRTLRSAFGVPPIEERMTLTRGEAFRGYGARTPFFFLRLF